MNPTLEAPEEAKPTVTETEESKLTAADRCDSCGAQAYFLVELSTGELTFCNHHWNKFGDKMADKAIKVIDESHKLLK